MLLIGKLRYSSVDETITIVNFRTFLSPPKEILHPLAVTPHLTQSDSDFGINGQDFKTATVTVLRA